MPGDRQSGIDRDPLNAAHDAVNKAERDERLVQEKLDNLTGSEALSGGDPNPLNAAADKQLKEARDGRLFQKKLDKLSSALDGK